MIYWPCLPWPLGAECWAHTQSGRAGSGWRVWVDWRGARRRTWTLHNHDGQSLIKWLPADKKADEVDCVKQSRLKNEFEKMVLFQTINYRFWWQRMWSTKTKSEYLTRKEPLESGGGGEIDETKAEHQCDPGWWKTFLDFVVVLCSLLLLCFIHRHCHAS